MSSFIIFLSIFKGDGILSSVLCGLFSDVLYLSWAEKKIIKKFKVSPPTCAD